MLQWVVLLPVRILMIGIAPLICICTSKSISLDLLVTRIKVSGNAKCTPVLPPFPNTKTWCEIDAGVYTCSLKEICMVTYIIISACNGPQVWNTCGSQLVCSHVPIK